MTRKRWILIGVVVVIVALVVIFSGGGAEDDTRVLATVSRGNLSREVNVSGTVIPAQDAELSFGVSGSVSSISYTAGDVVPAGAVIARLRNSSVVAERDEAEAALSAAQAELEQLKKGATVEDRALADAKLQKSDTAYTEAQQVLVRELREAFTVAEDALFNKSDQVFSNARSFPQLRIPGSSSQLKTDTETGRRALENILDQWRRKDGRC